MKSSHSFQLKVNNVSVFWVFVSFPEKFRTLLENLWACVEPPQLHPENHMRFPGETIKYILSLFCLILILNIYTFLTVFTTEHISKHTPPSSPQKLLRSHQSRPSPRASERTRKPLLLGGLASVFLGSNCNSPKLKSVDETTANRPQTHQQPRALKKETDTPKKSNRTPEEHKPEEASTDLFVSEALFEEIRALFKPMAPCISPISDLVRIHCSFVSASNSSIENLDEMLKNKKLFCD